MNIKKFYNEFAETYDKRHNSTATNYLRKKELDLIRKYSKGRVLDIGCGTGYHLKYAGDDAVGIDFSENMLKIARKKNIKNLKLASAENIPFRDKSFKTVFCFFGVLNMCNAEKAIKEMQRILENKGRVLLSVSSIKGSDKFRIYKKEIKIRLFSKKDIINLFRKSNFKLIYFDSVFKNTKPRWGDFARFSFRERLNLFLERFSKKKLGEICLLVFEKASLAGADT